MYTGVPVAANAPVTLHVTYAKPSMALRRPDRGQRAGDNTRN